MKHSNVKPNMRVLSFFMAVLMLMLTFTQGLGDISITVSAELRGTEQDGKIRPIPDKSKYLGPTKSNTEDEGGYKYTGNIKPVAISLYDYMTDYEINSSTWNKMNTTPDPNYTYWNRHNPYDKFNKKMSNDFGSPGDSVMYPHERNITIIYKSIPFSNNEVKVHIWNSSNTAISSDEQMTYTGAEGNVKIYKLTINVDALGFTPDSFVFSNGKSSGEVKTDDVIYSVTPGREYTFSKDAADDKITVVYWPGGNNGYNIYYWNGSNDIGWPGPPMTKIANKKYSISIDPNDDNNVGIPKNVIFSQNGSSQTGDLAPPAMEVGYSFSYMTYGSAWDVYPTRFDIADTGTAEDITVPNSKLYLGNFLATIPTESDPNANTNGGGDVLYNDRPEKYTTDAKKNISPSCNYNNNYQYSDFYWQANISQRPVPIPNTSDKLDDRPYAAIQGLVDSTLNGSGQITQNNIALPYFTNDPNWTRGDNAVMKAWESTAAEPIAFPFYEVLKTADDTIPGGYQTGANTDVTHKARYYEFNSEDANLHFVPTATSGYFEETDKVIRAAPRFQNSDTSPYYGKPGFFPFNTNDSWNGSDGSSGNQNNYGFGAKFQMNFKLSSDGKTETVDDNGNKIETGAGKVHTRFDFSGDDDLWVFIDDQLVLDIGGSHARVTGYIDFADREAVVTKAITYGTGGVDNLDIDGNLKSVDISSIMDYDPVTGYNENTVHTMTIFYMERGMAESNLLIRFNFPPESIYSKMKVKEQTDFSNVNTGLQNLTQKAAEKDVFAYHVENKNTIATDVLKENSYYGTDDSYIRKVQDIQTKLTPITNSASTKHFVPTGSTDFQDVKNTAYNWVDEYAIKSGTSEKMSSSQNIGNITDSGGYMYLMHGVPKSGENAEVKSSGEFEGQFSRYSMMKVTQSDTLYMPSVQDDADTNVDSLSVASLDSDHTYTPPTGTTPARTVTGYYNPKENYIFSTVDNNVHHNITNGDQFNFRNNIQSDVTLGGGGSTDANEETPVTMTVQFVNEPKVGSLIITKKVKAQYDLSADPIVDIDEAYKGEFTFKITLSDIFGIAGINPDDTTNKYSNIVVKRISPDNSTTYPLYKLTDSDTGGYHGEFKLKANELLIIDQIPVETKYKIEEDNTNTPNYTDENNTTNVDTVVVEGKLSDSGTKDSISYVDTNGNGQYDQGDAASSNNAFIVNTHITKGLVLQKTVTASNTEDIPNQNFTFRVNLTIPSEVDMTNYPLTRSDNNQTVTIETDETTEVKYFDVTIAGGETITINGLPKGVGYTVSEINIPANWKITSSSGLTGTISDTNNVNITNEYTKPPDPVIKLTKVDITDNNALITESPAQFKLLKLKTDGVDWTLQTTLDNFSNIINGDSYVPGTGDNAFVTAVYPSDSSTYFSTTDGVLTINEISAGNPFTPGDVYFFYEVTPPAGYEKDNTVTSSKVITLVRGDNFVTFPNSPAPLKMSVKKVDKDDTTKGLPGAEFELWIHDVIKTYRVGTYAGGTVEPVPTLDYNNLSLPDPLPVLYPTDTNKSVSYEWQEATDDKDYYYIKFDNTRGWSDVKMYIYNNMESTVPITKEKTSGSIYYFKNTSDATKIYFSDGTNGTNRTIDIDISSLITDTNVYPDAKHGYGYTFRPANNSEFKDPAGAYHQTDTNNYYMVQIENPTPTNSNKVSVTEWNSTTSGGYADYIWFYYGTTGTGNMRAVYYKNNNGAGITDQQKGMHTVQINGITHYFFKFEFKSGYDKIMFYNENNNDLFAIVPQDLSESMKGKIYLKGNYNNQNINNHPPDNNNSSTAIGSGFASNDVGLFKCVDFTGLYANATYFKDNSGDFSMGSTSYTVKTVSYPTQPVEPSESHDNYSAKYQPEDRYGFITDISGNTDINNFITIDTDMNDPYIMFYDSRGNNVILEETVDTKPVAASGMKLSVADRDGSNGAPYKIRLPKDAYYFVVSSGAEHTPNYDDYKISLYENNGYHHAYHHAGSTFYIKAALDNENKPTDDGVIDTSKPGSGVVKRIGYTATKTDISYPINPKTDADYIFFKDNNGFGSGVCAYYYGDVDGEYKPWPGVPAQRSYVDNDGKTVYVFQPPKSTNGKYKKVMFNDGTATNSRKITTAQDITLGRIYTTGSTTSDAYGQQTTTPYTVTTSPKGTTSTTAYAIGTAYIYFENNGTSTFNTGYGTSGRYKFDDMHFEFFADSAGNVTVGTISPGYIPDKIAGTDVYKIAVPDGAAYFRVNNGEKAAVTDSNATVNNTRRSEIFKITPNGLYKFVENTDAQEIWGNAAATAVEELDDYPYKIKDNFTATGTYIKLATVVTGDDGKQEYIKANSLKRKGTEGADANTVDDEYLSHTVADEGQTAGGSNGNPGTGIKVVKVKKQATITSTENITIANDTNNDGTPDNDTYDKVYYYWKETVAPAGYKLPDSGDEYTIIDTTTTDAGHHYDSTDSVYRPTVEDESIAGGKVTLTKTAKEKVGTTDIGSPLAGAEFKLVKLLADGTEDTTVIKFKQDTENTDGSYTTSSSGTFNSDNNTLADTSDDKWLVTGSDGKLVLNNVPIGSYYLEEMKAPAGYSNLESDGTTKKKVYFSIGKIGDTVPDKSITMADEMAPAYIKLYEHINEKREAWGDPTFVFKITQTQYYDAGGALQDTAGKTQLVALTVNDTGAYSVGLTSHSDPVYNYNAWLEESTIEAEYKGLYHIDSGGRIRLEPGTYQISRIPVSRYQFVENTYCMQDDADHSASYTTHKTSNEVLTVNVPVSKTAIVHYYDKVDYYDKFSQVDTKVNKFYTLDSTTKENRTIKGIRVEDYHQAGSGTPNPPSFIPDTYITSGNSQYIEVSNSRLNAYFIYSDGSEAVITDKNDLVISYISADNENVNLNTNDDFTFDSTEHKFKLKGTDARNSEKYTLTATYTFTGTDPPPDLITKFDLVFKVAES